jgi:hypothetical protein
MFEYYLLTWTNFDRNGTPYLSDAPWGNQLLLFTRFLVLQYTCIIALYCEGENFIIFLYIVCVIIEKGFNQLINH